MVRIIIAVGIAVGIDGGADSTMDITRKYHIPEGFISKEDGGDLLVCQKDGLEVHSLNTSLAAVYRMCDGDNACERMVVEFAQMYGMGICDASREVYRSLTILGDKKLICSQ